MTISRTSINDCFIIEPRVFTDKRGYFFENFNKALFETIAGFKIDFIQDNESYSTQGVLRGLHYQSGKYAQAKLVRVVKGEVLDIAVDIRENSKTFGQHVAVILSGKNKKQIFIPRGFAHGFVVLSESAILCYKCDNYYNKDSERGIIFNDKELDIDWSYPTEKLIISDKDLNLPSFKEAKL